MLRVRCVTDDCGQNLVHHVSNDVQSCFRHVGWSVRSVRTSVAGAIRVRPTAAKGEWVGSGGPWLAAEDLAAVPCHEGGVGDLGGVLRRAEESAPRIHELPKGLARAAQFLRHEQRESEVGGWIQPDGSPAERMVMELAEREPVRDSVRPPGGMPLDVGGIESQQIVVEPDVEVADRAATLVGGEDGRSESRVALSYWCRPVRRWRFHRHRFQKSHSVPDWGVERVGKVAVQQRRDRGFDESPIPPK